MDEIIDRLNDTARKMAIEEGFDPATFQIVESGYKRRKRSYFVRYQGMVDNREAYGMILRAV